MLNKHSLENIHQFRITVERLLQGEVIPPDCMEGFGIAMYELEDDIREKARENEEAIRGVMLILEAGWRAEKPVSLILDHVRAAYPGFTSEALIAQIEGYLARTARDPLGGLQLEARGDCDA